MILEGRECDTLCALGVIHPPRWPAWASTLIIRLSKTISIVARYISKRPNSPYWQFTLRVPNDLRDRYPSAWIRQSLKTTDEREAMRSADKLVAMHEAAFASMRGNVELTPAQTYAAARALADNLGPMETAESYFADLFNAHARKVGFAGHPRDASKKGLLDPKLADEMIKESDYLSPVQLKALALIRAGNEQAPRLGDNQGCGLVRAGNAIPAVPRSGHEPFVARGSRWPQGLTSSPELEARQLQSAPAEACSIHLYQSDPARWFASRVRQSKRLHKINLAVVGIVQLLGC